MTKMTKDIIFSKHTAVHSVLTYAYTVFHGTTYPKRQPFN